MTLTRVAVALCAVATSLVATATQAGPPQPGPEGLFCEVAAQPEASPDAGPDAWHGLIAAGPATTDEPGMLICTLQAGWDTVDAEHQGGDDAEAIFPSENGIIFGSETEEFNAATGEPVYLCTSFRKQDGSVIYFTGGDDARWHTDVTKKCTQITTFPTLRELSNIVDNELCPLFISRSNVEGPDASHRYYIDDEGDVFVDKNFNGIAESEAVDENVYDCPLPIGGTDASPGNGGNID